MNEAPTKPSELRQADLIALHRQLQEMAAQNRWSDVVDRPPQEVKPPVMVVRGK